MTTLYIADKVWMTVKAVEAVRMTAKNYYTIVNGVERKNAMESIYDAAFDTHDAAIEYLRRYAQAEIDKAQRRVAHWQAKLDRIEEVQA